MVSEKQRTYWDSLIGKKPKNMDGLNLGRGWNKGTKGIMKAWNKGGKLPQISGKNHYLFGKHLLEETKIKIGLARKGKRLGIPSFMKGKHQSEDAKIKIGNAQRGENSYRWIKDRNIVLNSNKVRSSTEHVNWSKEVYKKDNYTCQKYGTVGKNLRAHHILNFAQYPKLRFDKNNGCTLSLKAHLEFHKIYGNKNNTREQLEEFLSTPPVVIN